MTLNDNILETPKDKTDAAKSCESSLISRLPMTVLHTVEDYRAYRQKRVGTLALVPTMGALHEGHLSLFRLAREMADTVAVSIYVNPLQFGPNEDYAKYPKALEQDKRFCDELGVDVVFIPTDDVLYPNGQTEQTRVVPPESLTHRLCGKARPGHFTGVATVVKKLFNIIQPDVAIFGEKDAQQLAVIRRMVSDLNMPITIYGAPTVREKSGLAMSSRNAYLKSDDEQQAALLLSQILNRLREHVKTNQGELINTKDTFTDVLESVKNDFARVYPLFELEYLESVNQTTFDTMPNLDASTKVLIAAQVGDVRLIDNMDMTF